MKKIVPSLLLVIICLGLTSCNQLSNSNHSYEDENVKALLIEKGDRIIVSVINKTDSPISLKMDQAFVITKDDEYSSLLTYDIALNEELSFFQRDILIEAKETFNEVFVAQSATHYNLSSMKVEILKWVNGNSVNLNLPYIKGCNKIQINIF